MGQAAFIVSLYCLGALVKLTGSTMTHLSTVALALFKLTSDLFTCLTQNHSLNFTSFPFSLSMIQLKHKGLPSFPQAQA